MLPTYPIATAAQEKSKVKGPHEAESAAEFAKQPEESANDLKIERRAGTGNLYASEYLTHPNVFAMWRYLRPNLGASIETSRERDNIAEGNAAAEVTAKYHETLRKRLVQLQTQIYDKSEAGARRAAFYCSQAQVVATVAGEYAQVLYERIQANLNAAQPMNEQKLADLTLKEYAKEMNTRLADLQELANVNDGELMDGNSLEATVADDTREEFETVLQTRLARLQNECYWANPLGIVHREPSSYHAEPWHGDKAACLGILQRDAQLAHQEPSSTHAGSLPGDEATSSTFTLVNNPVFSDADYAALTMPRLPTPVMPLIPTTKVVAGVTTPLTNTATMPVHVGSDAGMSKFEQLTLLLRQMQPALPAAMAGSKHGVNRLRLMLNTALDLVAQSHVELDASTGAVGLPPTMASTSAASKTVSVAVVPEGFSDTISAVAAALNATSSVSAKDKATTSAGVKTLVVSTKKKDFKLTNSALPYERPKPNSHVASDDGLSLVSPTEMDAKASSSAGNIMTAKASNADPTNLAASVGLELCALSLKAFPKADLSGRATPSPYVRPKCHVHTTAVTAVALGPLGSIKSPKAPTSSGGELSQGLSSRATGLGSYESALSPPSVGPKLELSTKMADEAGTATSSAAPANASMHECVEFKSAASHAEAVPWRSPFTAEGLPTTVTDLTAKDDSPGAAALASQAPSTKTITVLSAQGSLSGTASLESQNPSSIAADSSLKDASCVSDMLSMNASTSTTADLENSVCPAASTVEPQWDSECAACPNSSTVRPQLDTPSLSAGAERLNALESSEVADSDTELSSTDDSGGEINTNLFVY